MSKVAVLKTSPKGVVKDYGTVMRQAGYRNAMADLPTILKLNLSWTLYFPSCSTQPWQLEGVLNTLKEDGIKDVIPVENQTVVTKPWEGARLNRWLPVLEKYGLEFRPLTDETWVKYKPKAEMLAMYDIFPDGFSIPRIFFDTNVVHLPTMKTHGHTTITGSMKNAFGGLLQKQRHHAHRKIHEVIVDLLAIQKEIHKSIITAMDGTVAGDGRGPRTMVPRTKDYILSSTDPVAADAISAKMMGFDPMRINFIKLAHDRGLGVGDPKQIDIVGEDISNVNFEFRTGKSTVIFFDQLLRNHLRWTEKVMFHTPLFRLAIIGSNTYHDHFWHPLVGKSRIRKFMKTKWGKKFEEYQA